MSNPVDEHQNPFKNRRLVIATKHNKETVIAPLLESSLGVTCIIPENLDTDLLGTFTGEKERVDDPITTARRKCEMAMEATQCNMAIASEGSFCSHPVIFFAQADDEIIMLVDKKNDLEIIAREVSTETNFNGSEINSQEELMEFASNAKFPSHALILRKDNGSKDNIHKGIKDWEGLKKIYQELHSKYGKAYVETDMRAIYNPSRMLVIEKAAKKLVEKLNSCCPECHTPGFEVTESKPGLPCSLCGFPTRSPLYYISSCVKCEYTSEKKFPLNKQQEDPMYCDHCNP